MPEKKVLETIARYGVVPAIAVDSVETALPLADAMLEGGLPVLEITFRTAAAAEVIQTIAQQRPEMLIGAGTVLTPENLQAAADCGAQFGVAPGLNPEIVQRAGELGMPFVPGVATPSEVERALGLGCRLLKLFPVEALGGIGLVKALAGPYRHTGVQLMPTGGIHAGNLVSYLALDVVSAVGGSWIATKDDLQHGRWDVVRKRCEDVAGLVAELRR